MSCTFEFERLSPDQVDHSILDDFDDRLFTQREPWLDYLLSFVSGEVVYAALHKNGRQVGIFTGLMIRRAGVKILASPFRGWTTPYMGFNLMPGVPRGAALKALQEFTFHELGCLHLEITDRYLDLNDGLELGFSYRLIDGYLSDLTKSEDQIWAEMSSACRRAIRKSNKCGVVVEPGKPEGFAETYYEHLVHVFAKQGLSPSYGAQRIQHLIDTYYDTGDLLLLRAFEPGGRCIATGIFPRFRHYSFFLGNGSDPSHLSLRPNEALHWYAMRYWKARGSRSHDWGGGGSYKAKYGGVPFIVPSFWKSRYGFIRIARDIAEKAYYFPRLAKRRRYVANVRAQRGKSDA